MSLAAGFDYFQLGAVPGGGGGGELLGAFRILLKSPQLITWREVHRLVHFRSGAEARQGHV